MEDLSRLISDIQWYSDMLGMASNADKPFVRAQIRALLANVEEYLHEDEHAQMFPKDTSLAG